ncbi:MAG: hypothetical protein R2750_05380 [Bacteroidales bacterium]
MTKALACPVNLDELHTTYTKIQADFQKGCPQTNQEITEALSRYFYPKGITLTKDADVDTIEVFTEKQLAQLAFLRHLIMKVKNENIRNSLLLSFSSSVNKFNRTFHYTVSKGGGGGDSAAFRYYRYRIAPRTSIKSLGDF